MDFDEEIRRALGEHDPVVDDYLLPTHVACNIPRYSMSVGHEPSSFNHARGELMESCRHTDGQPVALLVSYVLLYDVSLATVIDSRFHLPDGRPVKVETEFRRYWDTQNEWSIKINGQPIVSASRAVPPHPRMVGSIVRAALAAATPGSNASARRAAQRNTHLAPGTTGRDTHGSRHHGPSAQPGGLG